MKGTVLKRLDIYPNFGTSRNIFNFHFLLSFDWFVPWVRSEHAHASYPGLTSWTLLPPALVQPL